jgi:hypothetical protein
MTKETRKHGSTTKEIVAAIEHGNVKPKDIVAFTGLKSSAARMHLKRMTEAGKLVRTSSGYAIPDAQKPPVASLAA